MVVAERPREIEADEIDGDKSYEVIDGVLVEKPMGAKSDEIALTLGSRMRDFVRRKKLGRVFGSQTSYRNCFPHNALQIRKPDVSFVALDRLEDGVAPRGDFNIAPDLAVEVISPGDHYEYVEDKVFDYRMAGVKLIWIVNPKTKSAIIRRLDGSCSEVDVRGTLSGEDVVPGFECAVAELFE